jgi:hypothetical protein
LNPTGWKCPRRVGFLFPHECDRISPDGCVDCENGNVLDPFAQRTDRYGYTDYDTYRGVGPGGLLHHPSDFTEADGENLVRRRTRYEEDMSAS